VIGLKTSLVNGQPSYTEFSSGCYSDQHYYTKFNSGYASDQYRSTVIYTGQNHIYIFLLEC